MSIDTLSSQSNTEAAGWPEESARQAAIARAYLRPDMLAADIDLGAGFVAAEGAPRLRRFYLVSPSAARLDEARKSPARPDSVELHAAAPLVLPFPEQSLDVVFAAMVLHPTRQPLAAIREMARVLRSGGRLVTLWQGHDPLQLRRWLKEAGMVNVIVESAGAAEGQARAAVWVAVGARRTAMQAAVRENYAAAAQAGPCSCGSSGGDDEESCCGSNGETGCCQKDPEEASFYALEYSTGELSGAPAEAADFSLGCGNPIAMANLKPGEVVVDIGSGGGLDAFLAAARVGPKGRVIGVDMTPAMLERARASAERNSITNVEFRRGYAEQLPLEDGAADVVLSNCVINLTEDKGRVFEETYRVLKPGGRLEVSDVVASGSMPVELQENASGWAGCVTGALPEQEYLELISQAGFRDLTVRRRAAMKTAAGEVSVYSAIVSAHKPGGGPVETLPSPRDCGCAPTCC